MAKGGILSLIVLFVLVAIVGAVGFVAWTIATDVGANTKKRMEKKNISFTKDGMKVGVKERTVEQQEDSAQNLLVNIWNNSSFPNYKSRLGWMDGQASPSGSPVSSPGAEKRKAFPRSSSGQKSVSRSSSVKNGVKA